MYSASLRRLVLASIVLSGCFGPGGCLGALGIEIPDAGSPDDIAFAAIIGDPTPLFDGGETLFGGLTFTTTVEPPVRIISVSDDSGPIQTLVYPLGDDTL